MPESISRHPLVWIDCEMTGLNYDTDTILSIACFVTDYDLNLLDEAGYEVTVHHDKETLDQMGEWCIKHHRDSGLTAEAIASTTTHEQAAQGLLEYVKRFVPQPKVALLAGNTVHADRAFLRRPPYDTFARYLHHRILDVSAIKEAARRWAPKEILKKSPQKKGLHEARADILESIAEAKYYRDVFFRRPSEKS
ncbi:ribonuclease H-like protein [Saccharata proteae CBS 121410]|uniref:Ribonuclease H-like protein n=1 Tax=Saccharata proteae CBS 121410 TaxID=1314787 RepID=A0A9P4LST1_9PEZI|nr:ribonuclease H-like protein [Saccharata proteae CBS 121410]